MAGGSHLTSLGMNFNLHDRLGRPRRWLRWVAAGGILILLSSAGAFFVWQPWYIPNLLARDTLVPLRTTPDSPPYSIRARLLALAGQAPQTRSGAPLDMVLQMGQEAVSLEEDWLLRSIGPMGAIYQNPDRQQIIPYFANLSALSLVNSSPADVKDYINWYLAHINRKRDVWGFAGTIYDYKAEDGGIVSTDDYDSADSYAATFLSAVAAYYRATGDKQFIHDRLPDLKRVASVIIDLQNTDGLCWAKPRHYRKYLMDNSEVYRGLKDFAGTLESIGEKNLAQYYDAAAGRVQKGILTQLWDEEYHSFIWAIDNHGGKRMVNWGKWYPDVISQVYPIVTGVLSPDDPRALAIYDRVNQVFPDWPSFYKTATLPWSVMGYTAYVMGDNRMAMEILEAAYRMNQESARPKSWHALESAFLMLTYQGLAGRLPIKFLAE